MWTQEELKTLPLPFLASTASTRVLASQWATVTLQQWMAGMAAMCMNQRAKNQTVETNENILLPSMDFLIFAVGSRLLSTGLLDIGDRTLLNCTDLLGSDKGA